MTSAPDRIALEAGAYLVRTLTVEDATERCGAWFSDPYVRHMLNSPATDWSRDAVVKYIKQFDQKSNLLLGVFTSEEKLLIGILTAKINWTTRQGLITTLIGESSYRNKGALSAARVPFYDYLFDTLRLKMILATALTRNDILMKAMLKHGWKLDQTLKNHVKSNSDGTMLDLCLFSLTRDAHRAWKKANRPHRRSLS